VDSFERPPSGYSRFYVITGSKTFASPMIPNDDLQAHNHPLALLGEAAQATITEIRRTT
jgi:hypothetical protein